jgi:WD40 repeat protein
MPGISMVRFVSSCKYLIEALIVCICLGLAARSGNRLDGHARLEIKLPADARSLAYTLDGARLAVGHSNGQVSLCDNNTGGLQKLIDVRGEPVETVFFTTSGDRLVTITKDDRARIWSVAEPKQISSLEGITPVSGLSPDGRWLVTQNPKHAIILWDMSTMKPIKQLGETGLDGALNINFTADSKRIAVAYHHKLNLMDLDTGKINEVPIRGRPQGMKVQQIGKDTFTMSLGSLDDDSAIVHCVVPSKSGSLLAVGRGWYGKPNFIDVWDYSTGKIVGRFKPKDDGALAQFSFDNSLLAVGGANSVTVWSVANGQQVASLKTSLVYKDTALAKGSSLFAFSPSANELAVIDGTSLLVYTLK